LSLMLMKPKLLPFILLFTGIVIVDQIYLYLLNRENVHARKQLLKNIFLCCLYPVVALLVTKSWHIHLQSVQQTPVYPLHISLSNVISLLTGHVSAYEKAVFTAVAGNGWLMLVYFLPILIYLVFIRYYLQGKNEKNRFLFWQILLTAGLFLYMLGVMSIFLFAFNDAIDVKWGFLRYYRIYICCWLIFLMGVSVHMTGSPGKALVNRASAVFTAIFIGIFLYVLVERGYAITHQKDKKFAFSYVKSNAELVVKHTLPQDKIFIITNKMDSYFLLVISYELMPRKYTSVVATKNLDLNNLKYKKAFQSYHYLWVIMVNKDKKQGKSELFRIDGNKLIRRF